MTLWRIFRTDRFLSITFVLLLICAWLPLGQTPFLPFIDLQNNVGGASLLYEAATGGPMSRYFEVNWHPVPYWTGYFIMAVVSQLAGTIFAAKFICGLLSFVLPLSVIRLLVAMGRDPRQGLWGFLFVWDRNLYAGWVSYLLGMAIALYTIALLLEIKDWRGSLKVTAMSMLVALTHFQALGFLAVAGIPLVLTQKRKEGRFFLGTLGLSGGLLGALPWVLAAFEKLPADQFDPNSAKRFIWDTPQEKMAKLYDHVMRSFGGAFDTNIPVLVFCLMIFGPLLLASLRRTRPRASNWPPLVLTLSALFLYLVLPFSILGPVPHKHNYVRYGTFFLLGMMMIPRPRLDRGNAWALLPGIVLAFMLDFHVYRQLRDVGGRLRPYLDIIAAIRPHSRILPVIRDIGDPACHMAPFDQLHSYASGATRSFDPLFFDNEFTPILYRKDRPRPPYPHHTRLDYDRFIKYYDYVLVQGLDRDPLHDESLHIPVHVVKEVGIWRLYEVDRK